jgi:cytochrome b561
MASAPPEVAPPRYGAAVRRLHWLTAVMLAMQVPVGVVMSYRGNVLNLWDRTTDFLFSAHKSLGFILLIVVVVRLAVRLTTRVPPLTENLPRPLILAARANHAALYGLLLAVASLGWLGASLFPALQVFGVVSLPSISGADRAASDRVLSVHAVLAFVLVALAALHIAAALYHRFIRRDGVLRRMWG